jgi:transposase
MSARKYSEEFKVEAVKQVTVQGHPARQVAKRLGVSLDTMYRWVRERGRDPALQRAESEKDARLRRLEAELRRVTEERDILKKAAAYFAKGSR